MAATQTTNNNSIRSILDNKKLNDSNFLDWYRNPRIVFENEQKLHHLEEALLEAPPALQLLLYATPTPEEGHSLSTYVLKMKAYLKQMERLGYPMALVLGVNLILTSLSIDMTIVKGSSETTAEWYIENYKNVSQDIWDQLNAEAEAVQIILIGIDNDIYSTVDACPNACEMWNTI
nr:zinc finger, CCHC-type [Tanacetum cinerariifolium]GFA30634.1 zinc finger, CCHC-type [Tanacetum cinerariifolium]